MEMLEISSSTKCEESGGSEESEILKPGTKIKPTISEKEVEKLAERLYGITVLEISELISYDDRNFFIREDRNIKNPIIANHSTHGYILKVLNALDSHKAGFIDAQTKLMLFLAQQNITCPKPIMNVYGKYYSTELLGTTKHIVRLLEYIPGKIFKEVPLTNNLFYQAGVFVAKFDRAIKNFTHDAYKTHKSLWMLDSVPKLEEFAYALKDISKQEIVEEVIAEFKSKVMGHYDKFEKGVIHGDFNEHNILVNKCSSTEKKEYAVSGILDFGDSCYTLYIFELAIAMAYMMLQTGELETGGFFLAGYESIRLVPQHEYNVLRICVAARLCQSLVLGIYTHTLDPENEYILTSQKNGWQLLQLLWSEKKTDELWRNTADEYLKQSYK
ncbi:hydroxylysine kinase [Phlebotomus papatasi]|uniref:hydroxylysine kinase n=1 Tax=Phlebotomus papatasi TaxID=29031 RepID=UPI00248372D4|nr:hydroxylysine kinase [Phlebotomus papatasi]XP_055712667.1 hydroxylysine kinase [Phlebotomus papatasi]XP_055712669.1 hydroxylysine kinase [Phlebotomus papatasi]